jgi:hypothetical protein
VVKNGSVARRRIVCTHTAARILDLETHARNEAGRVFSDADFDGAAVPHRLASVRDQVVDDETEQIRIEPNGIAFGRPVGFDRELVGLSHARAGAIRELDERDGKPVHAHGAREAQKIADQAVQSGGFLVDDVEQIRARVLGQVSATKPGDGVHDDGERISHLVSDGGRELADGCELLFARELVLDLPELGVRVGELVRAFPERRRGALEIAGGEAVTQEERRRDSERVDQEPVGQEAHGVPVHARGDGGIIDDCRQAERRADESAQCLSAARAVGDH